MMIGVGGQTKPPQRSAAFFFWMNTANSLFSPKKKTPAS